GVFGEEGQILYRRRDQATGSPVPDTNTAADWAQMTGDVINGRKVLYPGWDLDAFFFTAQVTEPAALTVAIAPDNAYQAIVDEIDAATGVIQIETLTFENVAIGDALVAAASRGVAVTVLLEGGPPGGIDDHQRYICQQLEAAGGQCWFLISDSSVRISDRYRYLHAKFMLIDGERVIVSSENLSPNSLPDDDKSDGTWGRRGVVLITDAPGVVARVQAIFDRDFAPADHVDLLRWQSDHATYGAPPPGFLPVLETGGVTYTVRFPMPTTFTGSFAFEVVQAPENSLRDRDGLLGLVGQAGAGDTILVQQLVERPYWGETSSNAVDDPNPRLEAYIAAARRGADVRLLLDEHFDDSRSPVSNAATCAYVTAIAAAEALSLECTLANPAGLGIHNKMVLLEIGGRGYVHVGSLNGSEQSSKGNREVALQVQSDGAYALLAEMFGRDWLHPIYLPVVLNHYTGPASTVLISEILYDPPGLDDAEFVELVNPTGSTIDLSSYSLGDAVNRSDFEDVRRFPAGTMLAPGQTLVVAAAATAFNAEYGFAPDFEIIATDAAVPDLVDDLTWGDPAALLQLANGGDEVILRDTADRVVDVVTYGSGSHPGVIACALVAASDHSLERFPYWRDTNDCTVDFRDWPFPNPGSLP
ncbi:MAG TPA: phospholipase D-like domain-containing protein, partial [Anaerolineae bacterium]